MSNLINIEENKNEIDDTGFFTSEDQRILNINMKRREEILDKMFENGAPDRSGDIRVAKEVMESMDNKIIETAKLRAKTREEDNKDRHIDLIVETLKRTQKIKEENKQNIIDVDVDDDYMPDDVVPGEMETEFIELNINDFTNNRNEDS